jgi:LacI family transcriptional regulator
VACGLGTYGHAWTGEPSVRAVLDEGKSRLTRPLTADKVSEAFSSLMEQIVPRGNGRKVATLADVAAAVGVSPAAVSLALRGKPGVSETTRQRIVDASRSLGYRPLSHTTRHHQGPLTVTLVIRALHGDSPGANRFYGPVLAGVEERCRRLHIRLMLAIMPVDQYNHPIEVPHSVTDRLSDGLIFVGAHFATALSPLLEGAPPTVLVDAYAEEGEFDTVETDNILGGRAAVEHLVSRGHRNIAILGTDPEAFPSILLRRRGYEQAMAEAGLTPRYIDAPYYEHEAAAAAAISYLCANPSVTALFCANDLVAITFILAAKQAGISVPERVSVVGFDDIDLAGFVSPTLTTMAVDKVGMGRLAVTLLAHRVDVGEECVTSTLVRPQLIERESVRTIELSPPSPEQRPMLRPEPEPVHAVERA